MTRTQVQIPDVLLGRVRRYAESRETSVAEFYTRNVRDFEDLGFRILSNPLD